MSESPSALSTPASWSDVYGQLRAHAEASRGTITVTAPDMPEVVFPQLTAADAFAMALVFDTPIYEHASETFLDRWETESDLLAGEPDDGDQLYVGSRSFWEALGMAAAELDAAHAPVPSSEAIEAAMLALDKRRNSAGPTRNGLHLFLTLFSEKTFRAMAARQLEFFRSLRGRIAGAPSWTSAIPATSNRDVCSLSQYWAHQLARIGDNAAETFHRVVYSCWRVAIDRVERVARHSAPTEMYPHNAEFWSALLMLCTHSDACNEHPLPWAYSTPPGARNADGGSTTGSTTATLEFPAAESWDEGAKMQRNAFAKLRGEDAVTGRLISRVPRTTVSDVRQVARYWSETLARVAIKAGLSNLTDASSKQVFERWKAAMADVRAIPTSVDQNSVYEHNTEFWEAVWTMAIQLAVTDEKPTSWQLAVESTVHAVKNLPDTLLNIPHAIGNTLQNVADAGARLVGRPLLYVGAGLGGLALAVYLFRRSSRPEPSRSERTP